jgi:hypothetical protein
MKTLTVRLSDALWQRLRAYSYTTDARYNTVIVDALEQHLLGGLVSIPSPITPEHTTGSLASKQGHPQSVELPADTEAERKG